MSMIARLPILCELYFSTVGDDLCCFCFLQAYSVNAKTPVEYEAEVLLMLDQSSIQKILRDNLPDATNDLLCQLSEEVEKEMESHGKTIIRNLLTQGHAKARGALFNVDIKI